MRVGVLALQGAFVEHQKALLECNCEPVQIRKKEQLSQIDGLIIPGGESTTIGKLLVDFDLLDSVKEFVSEGNPLFGTCAGLIVMANKIEGSAQPRLGVMDILAKRNAFGRQVDSFETDLEIKEIGPEPLKAVFIRAPFIAEAGPEVKIMARFQDKIVLAQQGNLLASAFHPELTDDRRLHLYFLKMIEDSKTQAKS